MVQKTTTQSYLRGSFILVIVIIILGFLWLYLTNNYFVPRGLGNVSTIFFVVILIIFFGGSFLLRATWIAKYASQNKEERKQDNIYATGSATTYILMIIIGLVFLYGGLFNHSAKAILPRAGEVILGAAAVIAAVYGFLNRKKKVERIKKKG